MLLFFSHTDKKSRPTSVGFMLSFDKTWDERFATASQWGKMADSKDVKKVNNYKLVAASRWFCMSANLICQDRF
jgi:hypothetical protein